jgi:DNA-directed RNA polymerase specialized sigma24 family protein
MDTENKFQRLLVILRRVLANRDWRLLNFPELGVTEAEAVRQMAVLLQTWQREAGRTEITDELIERAVVNAYCQLLHRAVGLAHTAAQERAFAELWAYVTPLIGRVLRDDQRTAICANEVLFTLWRRRGAVQDPGCFLSYAAMIAGRAALAMAQAPGREVSFSDLFGDGDDAEDERAEWPDASTAANFRRVEDQEQIEQLAGLIRGCLRKMRAGAEVVIRLVLLEETVSEAAMALKRSAANIHLIKFRALHKLKKCPDLLTALGQPSNEPIGGGV